MDEDDRKHCFFINKNTLKEYKIYKEQRRIMHA